MAVNDNTHDVYVADSEGNRVDEFSPSGVLIREIDGSGLLPGEGRAAGSGGLATEIETGHFVGPTWVAVDNSGSSNDPSHEDIYIVDNGHDVIDKYNSAGTYIGQIIGTTCEAPTFEQIDEVLMCSQKASIYRFEELSGVAVAGTGNLWTVEKHSGNIASFSNSTINEPVSERLSEFADFLRSGMAVDSEGNLYVNPEVIGKIDSAGKRLIYPFCGSSKAFGVAVDRTVGVAYVDQSTLINACNVGGEEVEDFGFGSLSSGSSDVTVDASNDTPNSHTVYVSRSDTTGEGEVAEFPLVSFPTVQARRPSEQKTRSVTLNGAVDPEGRPVTSCMLEYDIVPYIETAGVVARHGTTMPCKPSSLGEGSAPEPVSDHLIDLTPETHYYYMIRAANVAGESTSCEETHKCQEFYTGPLIEGEFSVSVTSSSAILREPVNPNGDDTHYYFEYGTSESYGAFAPANPPGHDLGNSTAVQTASALIADLQAGAEYHYRLVVEQDGEVFEEPDALFETQRSEGGPFLPDGRAWELVSPADKKGALIGFFPGFSVALQAADDGHGIAYQAAGQLGGNAVGKSELSYTVSSRYGTSAWVSHDLALPDKLPTEGGEPSDLGGGGNEFPVYSEDLLSAVVEPHRFTLPLSSEVSERTVYLFDLEENRFEPIVSMANTPPNTPIGTEVPEPIRVYAVAPDLRHVVIRSPPEMIGVHPPVALTEGAYSEYYEWNERELLPVGVLPDGSRYSGLMSVAGTGSEFGSAQRAMSVDGRWVAWTAGDPYSTPGVSLYVRDMVGEDTLQVGSPGARYQTMNSDGSRVFYVENGDLYVFDTASGATTDLTPEHGAESNGGVLESVSDVSEDGSYVYFVATGAIPVEATVGGSPTKGRPNLYLVHATETGSTLTYIATLSAEDERTWHTLAFGVRTANALGDVTSRVSPSGRFLAFMSEMPLTGYDNHDATSGERDEEVFLYDAVNNRLSCVSCNPTGARPSGVLDRYPSEPLFDRRGIWSKRKSQHDHWVAGSIPGWDEGLHNRSMYQPRYLSNNGRLFFDSSDGLVPRATNGVEDVYQYEPAGVGGCTGESATFDSRTGGCLNLLSSGISGTESAFYDASETGNDVFFITAAKLVGEDVDSAYDVYDAHVCTSTAPCPSAPVQPPPCTDTESCRTGALVQPELFGPPPSATFSGIGNVSSETADVATKKKTGRKQLLARALKACKRDRSRRRLLACERTARKRYAGKPARGHGARGGRGGRGVRR